ncbi:ParB/RepB/Spo0J family partition protein [Kushneria indalinina]|uniref:ParB family chromosome partitioning protein n=1 Tax=Kushneria indalinina DSM 14324 TaxID=1122140 RepID=A0A3D9DRE9_9GAMM|nr:ParB/RepB/Spo0J family partition protein [Kushneria indalinina]REC93298.1 ParB family chromosome partitioning protein [Kushneria indalinina DSM 14324]
MTMQSIPLSQLVMSPYQTRRTERSQKSIESMAESIDAHGMLQNLVVHKHRGKYGVTGGGTRFLALQLLASQKRVRAGYPVQCKVISTNEAVEASLVENTQRNDMHPADQYEAFKAISGKRSTDEIATRFGYSKNHVAQILKLGRVAPSLMEKFRADQVSLETMKALALFEDHETQVQVFEQAGHSAFQIRSIWQRRGVTGREQKALFVGEAAYVAAGGEIERDLFSDTVLFKNTDLLDQLYLSAVSKVEADLAEEGWAWVEECEHFWTLKTHERDPEWDSVENHQRWLNLHSQIEMLQAQQEAGDKSDDTQKHLDELQELADRAEARYLTVVFTDEDKMRFGVAYHIDRSGELKISRGIIRPEEPETSAGVDDEASSNEAGDDAPGADTDDKSAYSKSVRHSMCAMHTLALQSAVADDSKSALALYITSNIDFLYQRYSFSRPRVQRAMFEAYDIEQVDQYAAATLRYKDLKAKAQTVFEGLPEDSENVLEWLMTLDMTRLLEMFAYVMSRAVAGEHYDPSHSPLSSMQHDIGHDVSADAAEMLNAENFYGRLNKKQLMRMLENERLEVGTDSRMKRDELAEYADGVMSDNKVVPGFFK